MLRCRDRGDAMKRREFITLVVGGGTYASLQAAQAQQKKIPHVGVLWHAADAEWPYYGCLLDGFAELGYGPGKLELIHRFPNERPEKFQSMAAELVALAPDV